MKVHGNKEHSMKRVENEELYNVVQLQTWFQDSRERYWIVDESRLVEPERAGNANQSRTYPFIVIFIVIHINKQQFETLERHPARQRTTKTTKAIPTKKWPTRLHRKLGSGRTRSRNAD
jgi:hypothetical protein